MGANGQQGETLKLIVNLIIGLSRVRANSTNIAQAITDTRTEFKEGNERGGKEGSGRGDRDKRTDINANTLKEEIKEGKI